MSSSSAPIQVFTKEHTYLLRGVQLACDDGELLGVWDGKQKIVRRRKLLLL